MRFKEAIFYLTIDDVRTGDRRYYEAILFFTERDIILQSTIFLPAIGYFTKRYETDWKSHLQANAVACTDLINRTA
jgi:hypothetical protein